MAYDLDRELRRIIPYDLYLELISPRQLLFEFHITEMGSLKPIPIDKQYFYDLL